MELDVSKAFLKPGTAFPFQAQVNLPPQDVMGETVAFDEARLEGTYSVLENSVHLTGVLHTVVHAHCALCMVETKSPLRIDFAEVFRKDANETEDETFRYEGKAVPLDQLTLTLVMMNLPMRLLCKEGCRGSAEWQAWQDKNASSSCEDGTPTQRPFEALRSLLMKDEEV